MHGLMGPAILITLGIVFLSPIHHHGIVIVAALLIVIGVVKLLQANAPIDGHVNPYVIVTPVPTAVAQPSTTQPTDIAPPQEEQHG